jgi:NAD(P)-dependent dehydrogenase (short-subunit alcohol dehydrogenase family)
MTRAGSLFGLDGQVAIVTGASSGLGRHFALTLARAGAKVALAARRIDPLDELARQIEAFDGRAIPVPLDVTDPASVRACVGVAETELGPISILVNNAGLAIDKPVFDQDEADWDRVLDTNLKGAWMMAQEVARHILQGRAGQPDPGARGRAGAPRHPGQRAGARLHRDRDEPGLPGQRGRARAGQAAGAATAFRPARGPRRRAPAAGLQGGALHDRRGPPRRRRPISQDINHFNA